MKRFLITLLASLFMVFLVGCSSQSGGSADSSASQEEQTETKSEPVAEPEPEPEPDPEPEPEPESDYQSQPQTSSSSGKIDDYVGVWTAVNIYPPDNPNEVTVVKGNLDSTLEIRSNETAKLHLHFYGESDSLNMQVTLDRNTATGRGFYMYSSSGEPIGIIYLDHAKDGTPWITFYIIDEYGEVSSCLEYTNSERVLKKYGL